MKFNIIYLKTLLLVIVQAFIFLNCISQQRTKAILFGNSAYSGSETGFPPLNSPVVDITRVKDLLDSFGIESTLRPQITSRSGFFLDLKNFLDQCKNENVGTVVFYYSGHGVHSANDDFIVPVNFSNSFGSISRDAEGDDLKTFIKSLFKDTIYNLFDERQNIIDYNIINGCIATNEIIEAFKGFQLLLVIDACRTKITEVVDKSGGEVNADFVDNSIITDWGSQHFKNKKTKRINLLLQAWQKYYAKIQKNRQNFIEHSTEILSQLGDSKEKPVSQFFATGLYEAAAENPKKYVGMFTDCFIKKIAPAAKSGSFLINFAFRDNLQACIEQNTPAPQSGPNNAQRIILTQTNGSFVLQNTKIKNPKQIVTNQENPNIGIKGGSVYVVDTSVIMQNDTLGFSQVTQKKPALLGTDVKELFKGGQKVTAEYRFSFLTRRIDATIDITRIKSAKDGIALSNSNVGFQYVIQFNLLDSNLNILYTTIPMKINFDNKEDLTNTNYLNDDIPIAVCNRLSKIQLIVQYYKLQISN